MRKRGTVYAFFDKLCDFVEKEQRVPNTREAMQLVRAKSPRTVGQFYDQLERGGWIKRLGGARNIQIRGFRWVRIQPKV